MTVLAESDDALRFGGDLEEGAEIVATAAGITARWTDRWSSRDGGETIEITVPWPVVIAHAPPPEAPVPLRRRFGWDALLTMLLRENMSTTLP